jgi:hypothetical protein
MTPLAPGACPQGVTPEVLTFAREAGVAVYLGSVLEMTSRIFGNVPVTPRLEDDPDISNDRHIVFEVDVTGLSAEQLFEAQWRWSEEIYRHCPVPSVHVFRYGLVASA